MAKITKKINLGKLLEIKPAEWLKIGDELVKRIQYDTRRGVSQDDSEPRFHEYSGWYGDFKSQGLPDEKGRATNSQTNPPNLTYTGEMLRKIFAKNPKKNGVTIEFTRGDRVLENIRMENRNIFDINKKNMDWVVNQVVKIFDSNAKKA